MAVTNGYVTRDELISYIASANNQASIAETHRADELDMAINSASREIDEHCGRVFYDTGSATARVFVAERHNIVRVDDFHTTVGFVLKSDEGADGVFETTWSAADYQLEPLNGLVNGRTWPYSRIRAVKNRAFPRDPFKRALVEVTARWGWASPPAEVKQACAIQAHRILRRSETPEGVAGFGEFGAVRLTSLDRDVERLLQPFVKVYSNLI